jgi:methylase of polypeptide subunit release factors
MNLYDINTKEIVDNYFALYKSTRDTIFRNMSGLLENEDKLEFIDLFMIQLLILRSLEKNGYLNGNKNYIKNKLNDINLKEEYINKFNNYYTFLIQFLEFLNSLDSPKIVIDDIFGKFYPISQAIFMLKSKWTKFELETITIPDKFLYNYSKDQSDNNHINNSDEVIPLINLIEEFDWANNIINGYIIGLIYERIIGSSDKKRLAAYYTPYEISNYICVNSIHLTILNYINNKYKKGYDSIDSIFYEKDENILKDLFLYVKNLKILDPAMGSGHFLENAMEILLDIYLKIRNFIIFKDNSSIGWFKTAQIYSSSQMVENQLSEIRDIKKFKFIIKSRIIIPNNIYGVDVDFKTTNIARSRLFLSMCHGFNIQDCPDLMPITMLNLKSGNSLLGFIDSEIQFKKEKQLVLDYFIKGKTQKREKKIIGIDNNLKEYLIHVSENVFAFKNLPILLNQLEFLYDKPDLKTDELKAIVSLLGYLRRLDVLSLENSHSIQINELIEDIIEVFNKKLNSYFLRKYHLKISEINKINIFHYILEFSRVFNTAQEIGFDIIIGNPPYIRQEQLNYLIEGFDYKNLLSKIFEHYTSTFDLSMYFILRSLKLLKCGGFHSFIITNKWLRAKYGSIIRKLIKKQTNIRKIIDLSDLDIFKGITIDTMIYIIQKIPLGIDNEFYYNKAKNARRLEDGGYEIKQNTLGITKIWLFSDKLTNEIKEYLRKNTTELKDLNINIYFGIKTGFNRAFIIEEEIKQKFCKRNPSSNRFFKPLLRGRDIGNYHYEWKRIWLIVIPSGWTKDFLKGLKMRESNPNKVEELFSQHFPGLYMHFQRKMEDIEGRRKGLFNRDDQGDYWWELRSCDYYSELEKSKLVWNRIAKKVDFVLIPGGMYVLDSMFFIRGEHLKFLNLILESSLNSFLMENYCAKLGKGYYAAAQYIEKLPIKIPKDFRPFEIVAEYLLFLNLKDEIREKLSDIIDYFSHRISDCMIYELYFKSKFINDGIEGNFISLISKYLKSIDFDQFFELNKRKILGLPIDNKNYKQIQADILSTIVSVHTSLINDPKVLKQINKINNHIWVEKIEDYNK